MGIESLEGEGPRWHLRPPVEVELYVLSREEAEVEELQLVKLPPAPLPRPPAMLLASLKPPFVLKIPLPEDACICEALLLMMVAGSGGSWHCLRRSNSVALSTFLQPKHLHILVQGILAS